MKKQDRSSFPVTTNHLMIHSVTVRSDGRKPDLFCVPFSIVISWNITDLVMLQGTNPKPKCWYLWLSLIMEITDEFCIYICSVSCWKGKSLYFATSTNHCTSKDMLV